MIEQSKPKLTYEWMALENPKGFTETELGRARIRLKEAGVKRLPKP